jgi:hypothetical protein
LHRGHITKRHALTDIIARPAAPRLFPGKLADAKAASKMKKVESVFLQQSRNQQIL